MSKQGNPVSLLHAPAVPLDRAITTYTRFGTTYEPWEYTDWIDESMSWKDALYIGDWSPLEKLHVTGPEALKFFSDISVNSFAKFEIGQAKHVVFCNSQGKIMGEGVLMRLAAESFLFTSGPGVAWAHYKFRSGSYNAEATLISRQQYILQLQGPSSIFVLENATGENLRDIGFMRFRETGIGDSRFLALRQGMAGEIGFELHGPIEQAHHVYATLLECGQPFGIRRLGGRTKMVNHVEACFPTPSVDYIPAMFGEEEAGYRALFSPSAQQIYRRADGSYQFADISELYRTPTELGWGKNVKFDHNFLGRRALEEEAARPRRTMVTLVWNADDLTDVYASLFRKDEIPYLFMEMPRNILGCVFADGVWSGEQLVGISTSRCYSYFFREMLSLCVIDVALAEPGTQVEVLWGRPGTRQMRIRATVAKAPYKTDKRRANLLELPMTPMG